MSKVDTNGLERMIDANLNRLKEALRVCEDVCRFHLDDKNATRTYKDMRHQITEVYTKKKIETMMRSRAVESDVGRGGHVQEMKRSSVKDVYFANSQRLKESLRVLEEAAKCRNQRQATAIKNVRYRSYAIEKKIAQKI